MRKLSPGHPGILNNCGIVLRKLDRPAEALERFDQALALRPDYAEALANRGKLLSEQLNRPADALDSFDRALRLRPTTMRMLSAIAALPWKSSIVLGRGVGEL